MHTSKISAHWCLDKQVHAEAQITDVLLKEDKEMKEEFTAHAMLVLYLLFL